MSRPIRYGQDHLVDKEWTDRWTAGFADQFERYLAAYRERPQDYHSKEVERWPDRFILARPVEIVAVATLLAIWIFARHSDDDSIRVLEEWEDAVVADWDFAVIPTNRHEASVRERFSLGEEWYLLERQEVVGHIPPGITVWGFDLESARHDADSDAGLARLNSTLRGEVIDFDALEAARAKLDEIRILDAKTRGRRFDAVVVQVLQAHGCDVEQGAFGGDEQIDLFIYEPAYALVLCRWQSVPLPRRAIDELEGRVRRRPPVVSGLYVSMSGFGQPAKRAAQTSERAILLMDGDDLRSLAWGQIHFSRFWDMKVRARLRGE